MIENIRNAFNWLTPKEKLTYVFLLIGRSLTSALDVVGVIAIGAILAILSSGDRNKITFLGFQFSNADSQTVIILSFVVLVMFVGKGVLGIVFINATRKLFMKSEIGKVEELTRKLISLGLTGIKKLSRGELTHALSGSVQSALSGTLTPLSIFVSEISLLIYVTLTFFFINWSIATVTIVYFALVGTLIYSISTRAQKKSMHLMVRDLQESQNVLNGILDAFREIYVSGKGESFVADFVEKRSGQAKYAGIMTLMGVLPRYILEFALVFGLFAVLTAQGISQSEDFSYAILGVFFAGAMRIIAAMIPLQNSLSTMRSASSEAQAVKTLEEVISHSANSYATTSGEEKIEKQQKLNIVAKKVTFIHENTSTTAIDSVDIQIPFGSFVALIGPSGSGKTTFIDLLIGLHKPVDGFCTIGGLDSDYFVKNNPGTIAYVPQKPGLIDGSLLDNITLGSGKDSINVDQLEKALTMSHLNEVISNLPEGIHTSIGSQKDSLSGGQIQRLGLARAFYQNPKILILDEATSALDAITENIISEAIQKLSGKITIIVIAHRLTTVQSAETVYVFENGKIISQGKFRDLVKNVEMVSEFAKLMNISEK